MVFFNGGGRKRRWSNLEFKIFPDPIKNQYKVSGLDVIIKIDNILALKIDDDTNRIIYPYFSAEPRLREEDARIGLWLLDASLDEFQLEDIRILDIIRSQSFSVSEFPLQGNEKDILATKYLRILKRWETLWEEYK